jgi:hypothetical protein
MPNNILLFPPASFGGGGGGGGSTPLNVVTRSGNSSISATDGFILVDTSGGAFTLTLPNPASVTGQPFYIVDKTGFLSTNNLTLARFAAEMIEGLAASKVFQTSWGGWIVFSDGTDWYVF